MTHQTENVFNGMLIIRKEPGYTSGDVVARLRGILHMRKIGHTGTLDPMAEGVLPVCLGSATKLTELIADRDKEYIARMRLGVVTDTQDMTGAILQEHSADEVRRILLESAAESSGSIPKIPEEGSAQTAAEETNAPEVPEAQERVIFAAVDEAAERFRGEILQTPPMYSAVRVNGQHLYDLARKGITVERAARAVTISELEILSVAFPVVTLRVVCSKGTYIRTLCEDLGNALGTGGAMEHLLRTRVGQFTLEEALTLDEVQKLMNQDEEPGGPSSGTGGTKDRPGSAIERYIIPIDALFAGAPAVHVRREDMRFLLNGNPLSADNLSEDRLPQEERIRVYDEEGTFRALYRYEPSRKRILPVKMFCETPSAASGRK